MHPTQPEKQGRLSHTTGSIATPCLLVLAAGIVATPLSTKLAGALWVLLCVLSLWAAFRWTPSASPALRKAASNWAIFCIAAIALVIFARWYWKDPWDEIHFSVRMTLAALAGLALAGRLGTPRAGPMHQDWITHALAAACFAAFGLAFMQGEKRAFPTNAIPWAAGIAFLVCLLLPRALEAGLRPAERTFWTLGALAGVIAVLLSFSRGAYGIVFWFVFYCLMRAWRSKRHASGHRWPIGAVLALVAAGVLVVALSDALWTRLSVAYRQITLSAAGQSSTDDSIGARLELWQLAARGFAESPVIGVGGKGRVERIREAGKQPGSRIMSELAHVHSEYLQAALDHGLVGLAATLAIIAGLIGAVVGLGRIDTEAGWQIGGLAFMHLTAGVTNVNTAHNYYGTVLAVCVLLVFMCVRERPVTLSATASA